MLIGMSLMVIIILAIFSMILGNEPVGIIQNISYENEALIDGVPTTFEIIGQDVIFQIDTINITIAGIALISTIIIIALIGGFNLVSSGLTGHALKIIVMLTGFTGLWFTLTALAISLIISIEIFGTLIYIFLTICYTVGVVQKISG